MLNLQDINISYLIVSPEKKDCHPNDNAFFCSKTINLLYAKEYTLIPLKGYQNGVYENVYIALSPHDNDTMRSDSLYLISEMDLNDIIIKYSGETQIKRVSYDGSERCLELCFYDSAINEKAYITNGISFTIKEMKRYYFPHKKTDLKPGMFVEFLNNQKWVKRKIENVDVEYERMYKLLMKYEKVRFEY